MKVVRSSNFGLETVDEVLVCTNVDQENGAMIVEALNETYAACDGPFFYSLEADDYELYYFEP